MTLSNVCIGDDRVVYLVMRCADWESTSQPESDEDFDEMECDELLAKVYRTRHAGGKSVTITGYVIMAASVGLLVTRMLTTLLTIRRDTHKDKDQDATSSTTTMMDSSPHQPGTTTISRDFMEGGTIAERTDLYSDTTKMALNMPV
ncbi:unnamed protein product [Toxocara canis]|nr:unnamed protein product [Toxocara canis]